MDSRAVGSFTDLVDNFMSKDPDRDACLDRVQDHFTQVEDFMIETGSSMEALAEATASDPAQEVQEMPSDWWDQRIQDMSASKADVNQKLLEEKARSETLSKQLMEKEMLLQARALKQAELDAKQRQIDEKQRWSDAKGLLHSMVDQQQEAKREALSQQAADLAAQTLALQQKELEIQQREEAQKAMVCSKPGPPKQPPERKKGDYHTDKGERTFANGDPFKKPKTYKGGQRQWEREYFALLWKELCFFLAGDSCCF